MPEVWGACGGELWVQGGMEGVLEGVQGGVENQPLLLTTSPAGAPFPAGSLLPRGHRPADVCWTEHTVPTAPRWAGHRPCLGWFPLPCFPPRPLAMLSARLGRCSCPMQPGLSWPQVRKKRQHLW